MTAGIPRGHIRRNRSECHAPMKAKKILVVEDDKVAQKLIVDALKAAGYEVATAYDLSLIHILTLPTIYSV